MRVLRAESHALHALRSSEEFVKAFAEGCTDPNCALAHGEQASVSFEPKTSASDAMKQRKYCRDMSLLTGTLEGAGLDTSLP